MINQPSVIWRLLTFIEMYSISFHLESSIHWALPHYHFDEDAGDVELEIIRVGSDLSHTSVVWCATRLSEPPSANPGEDYIPSSTQVTFSPGQASQVCVCQG